MDRRGEPVYLRDGQTFTRISVYNGQPDRQATFGITQDGQTQTIQYYPRGKTFSAPQYRLDSEALAAHPESCLLTDRLSKYDLPHWTQYPLVVEVFLIDAETPN